MRCIFTLTPPLNAITKTLKGAHLGMKENESQEIFIFRSSEIHANPVFIINISKQNEIVKASLSKKIIPLWVVFLKAADRLLSRGDITSDYRYTWNKVNIVGDRRLSWQNYLL